MKINISTLTSLVCLFFVASTTSVASDTSATKIINTAKNISETNISEGKTKFTCKSQEKTNCKLALVGVSNGKKYLIADINIKIGESKIVEKLPQEYFRCIYFSKSVAESGCLDDNS
ncbi:hypothetical protein SAMN02745866_02983 [Alteromonadaceae bacterium Bs31]|nr:hypothetical protein SAMN02745866_02983 [Alteromonadaceae bacterium Bs31]